MKRFLLRLTLLPSLLASTVLGEDAVPPPATPAATPANWPQFRGPNGQGLALTARIPSRFGPDTSVLWKTPVPAGHSSPVVWNDRLFLTAHDKARPNELVTLTIDATNGRLVWQQAVESTSPAGFHPLNHPASSTPAVDAERVYVYFGTYGLPVRDMDVLLRIFDHDKDGLISETEWMQTMAGFAAHSQPYLAALRPGATRNARPSHLAWEIRRGIPETPSLLHCQGKLYLMRDGGVLTCLEATTGKELFRERIGAPGQYIASPVAAGDQLVVASVPGIVTVLALADELRILARNEFREFIFATPAVAGNRLYLRTAAHLYAVGD